MICDIYLLTAVSIRYRDVNIPWHKPKGYILFINCIRLLEPDLCGKPSTELMAWF